MSNHQPTLRALVLDKTSDDVFLSGHYRTMYKLLFPCIMVIGVLGNTMVILVILKTKEMRNSTNIFLANLATADLMTLLVWGTHSLLKVIQGWSVIHQSHVICKAMPFVKDTLTYVSVMTIFAISFERYYAICQPLQASYICTKRRAYRICVLVWVLAILSSSWQLLFVSYGYIKFEGNIFGPVCAERNALYLRDAYYITSLSLFFVLPLIMLTVLFIFMARHLKGAGTPSANTAALRHRRHVITMLATVVLCFFVCQLPYRVISVLEWVDRKGILKWLTVKEYLSLAFFCEFLVYLHSAANPILYNLMSERFREGFKNICMYVVNGCKRRQIYPSSQSNTTETTTRTTNTSSV